MPLRSNFHAFLRRICEGTEQIRKIRGKKQVQCLLQFRIRLQKVHREV